MTRGQRHVQRTARNYAAYGPGGRSSRITADVAYRLGRVPRPVDVKTTIGTMPRRQRGRGRRAQRGGAFEFEDLVWDDLRDLVKTTRVGGRSKADKISKLRAAGVSVAEFEQYVGREPEFLGSAISREARGVDFEADSSDDEAESTGRTSTAEFTRNRKLLQETVNPPAPQPEPAASADAGEVRAEQPSAVQATEDPIEAKTPRRGVSAESRERGESALRQLKEGREAKLAAKAATPAKHGTRGSDVIRTPGYEGSPFSAASSAYDTPPPASPKSSGAVAPTVSDPEALAALDRVAKSTEKANTVLRVMSRQTSKQLSTLNEATQKLVLNDPRMDADEVSTVVDRIKANPDVAGLVQAGLVRPEQLKDEAYVLSLKSALANRRDDGQPVSMRGRVRGSAAPVFERTVPSQRTPGLKYFKPAMHVRPSIFAAS